MSRLARIRHSRCNEIDGTSHFLVPADMTEEELHSLGESAATAFLDAERAAKGLKPVSLGYGPQYDRHPDKTVAEVKAEYEKERAQWERDEELRKAARKTFSQRVCELSNGRVKPHWEDDDEVIEVDVSWGHNHGLDKDCDGESLDT